MKRPYRKAAQTRTIKQGVTSNIFENQLVLMR